MQKLNKPSLSLIWVIRFIQGCLIWGLFYSAIITTANSLSGIIGILIFGLLLISSFYVLKRAQVDIVKDINQRFMMIGEARKKMFVRSPLPMLNMNMQGDIWWYNTSFNHMIGHDLLLDTNIKTILPEIQLEDLPKDSTVMEKRITIGDGSYTMYCELAKITIDHKGEYHYFVYFLDETERIKLRKQIIDKRCIVGIMSIDNYSEVVQNVEDIKRPILTALIDRRIHKWLEDEDIIIRKFERDKYMLIFPHELLEKMHQSKFPILDEMRKTQMGNELPITMSIGIGENIKSLTQSREEARAALDLALGRGGDQAVIKNQDKYTFYGGETKEVEKSTRVKARMKAYAFKELIQESDNVIVMGHKNMDMDCLGAAMGVYRAAAVLGKQAKIVLNEPTIAIQMLYNRIIEEEEYEDLFITNQEAEHQINNQTLLVIVDVHRASYVEYPKLMDQTSRIVVFDHHRRSTDYIEDAVLTYYESYISSTCEMIAEILQYFGEKVKLTTIEADALLAGITVDTKNFILKTGVRTFEAAAFLRRSGADSARVRMFFQSDLKSHQARALALKNTEIYNDHMAIAVIENDIPNAFIIAAQTADELLNIIGVSASFAIVQKNDTISISARSNGDINVQVMMEMLNGGGHQTVAGSQLEGKTIGEAISLLKQIINEYSKKGE